jgi:hypothetical protein
MPQERRSAQGTVQARTKKIIKQGEHGKRSMVEPLPCLTCCACLAALEEAQGFAENLLEAEMRLGELLAAIEPDYTMGSVEGTHRPHRKSTLPTGVTKKVSHQAQTLSDHRDVVAQVSARARYGQQRRNSRPIAPSPPFLLLDHRRPLPCPCRSTRRPASRPYQRRSMLRSFVLRHPDAPPGLSIITEHCR